MKYNWLLCACLLLFGSCTDTPTISSSKDLVSFEYANNYFPLYDGNLPDLYIDSQEEGILIAAKNLQKDIQALTGKIPTLIQNKDSISSDRVIIIGTSTSKNIKTLNAEISTLDSKWEQFIIQGIDSPYEGVSKALLIAGSDKRGAIYGIYELSEKMGVSPWYYWADVPIAKQEQIFINPAPYTIGEPKVKYRGIFINDEAPALSGWAYEKFGGFNSKFYSHVFELILRLKGNYLWPAMWGRSIYEDDPKSPVLADAMGIVLGTSHHEPLTRAHADWGRNGEGPWNYLKNKENLQKFWREGARRMGDKESILTIGMRGDGDEPMTEGTAIELLETIVADQRQIIAEETGKPAKETPQMWALYKEVQDYYDMGMRVDDDITLLLCDDNWGNIRKLPAYGDTARAGGYGIYYHFDYVGGPRNYKWINTSQIARVWEQMTTAYDYGVDQIWIVNVGDIKPMEFPISFFLDLAWEPDAISALQIPAYGENWAAKQFGAQSAEEIAHLLDQYTLFNSRRKPELLDQNTYSLMHFREFEKVVQEYKSLAKKAQEVKSKLDPVYHEAYFQLVEFPILASANLNEMYYETAKNHLYAQQGRAATSKTANSVKDLYENDSLLTLQYHSLKDGKWNHMMAQTHIGYTYWQQPEKQSMPEVTEEIELAQNASPAFMVENSSQYWPAAEESWSLPSFDSQNDQSFYIELFNQGEQAYSFTISAADTPLKFDQTSGQVSDQLRIEVSVDWSQIDKTNSTGSFELQLGDSLIQIAYAATKLANDLSATVINNGLAGIDASRHTQAVQGKNISWLTVHQMGRTGSSVIAQPSYGESELDQNTAHLEYDVLLLENTDSLRVKLYTAPTLNYHNDEGLSYAVSFDDQEPQIINIHNEKHYLNWNEHVANNAAHTSSYHALDSGLHTLKIWHIDSKIPMQKIDLIIGEEPQSYLGAR